MSKSLENLKTAFAGESQANRKYLAFAKKADEEGFPQIARLFRAAAAAETVHANNHFRAMDGIKSTAENLENAIAGENYEVVSMYPPMLAEAIAEGKNAPPNHSSGHWRLRKSTKPSTAMHGKFWAKGRIPLK